MSETPQTEEIDLSFLNQRLSPFRGEYLPVVLENFSLLMQAFDRYVLKGAPSESYTVSGTPLLVTSPYGKKKQTSIQ